MAYSELEKKFGGHLDQTSMKDRDYKGKNVYWLRFSGGHCPICGEANGWCVVNVTGTKVICMKTPNDHPLSNGGYFYYLNDNTPVKFDSSKVKKDTSYKFADPATSGIMNKIVADFYPLSDSDRKNLNARGMDDAHINLHTDGGFGTLTKKVQASTTSKGFYYSEWTKLLLDAKLPKNLWHGVMGFYGLVVDGSKSKYEIPMYNLTSEGMLVPYFSIYNEILGYQLRLDNPPLKASPKGPKGKNGGYMLKCGIEITVNLSDDYKTYEVVAIKGDKKHSIAKGSTADKEFIGGKIAYNGQEEQYVFELKPENKYRWVSSRNKHHGASGHGQHMPIEVAYNDEIARLSSRNESEKKALESYIAQDKGIWLTEGGLKALVTASNLPKQFSKQELDMFGRDVLAVAGVTSYADFLPVLKKLHVSRATIAFDMDLLQNDNVLASTTKLVNMLIDNGIQVFLASWDVKKAKGIDDALANNTKIQVRNLRK